MQKAFWLFVIALNHMGNLEIIGYSRYLKTPVSLKLRRDMTNYMWKVEHSKMCVGGGGS